MIRSSRTLSQTIRVEANRISRARNSNAHASLPAFQKLFRLDGRTGQVRTAGRLDREALPSDTFDLFVQSTPSRHLIELRLHVTDINDNAPTFLRPVLDISFSETDQPGTQVRMRNSTPVAVATPGNHVSYDVVFCRLERFTVSH